ncbi:MAG: Uma2 family endonuclease [Synechococcaceae cyanobacterium SM2_3_1]|nr:Uma2 family endonuclease [Synechococcaceae cyanobacterium SM2_3_1]
MTTSTDSRPVETIPPLQSGDRLSWPEFERRYSADPHIHKAELIEGVVYVASPLRHRQHGRPHSRILTWLGVYQAQTPGTDLSVEPTVRLDVNNEPQPDAVLFIAPECEGQIQISPEGYIEGAPELIVEIAASSESMDLGEKKQIYCRNGVKEYLVWQTHENILIWHILEQGAYRIMPPDTDGVICSQIFPGLWLSTVDLIAGNMIKVLEFVQRGIASDKHRSFVEMLAFKR